MARCDWRPYYGVVFEIGGGRPVMHERMFMDREQARRVAKAWKRPAWGIKAVAVVAVVGRTATEQRALWKMASAPYVAPNNA